MRKLAALLAALALAGCASIPPAKAEIGYGVGKIVLAIGNPDGSTREVEVEVPTSVQGLFACLTRERDPILPFDTCDCYRQMGVSIPEASMCFGEGETPAPASELPDELVRAWEMIERRMGALDPEITECKLAQTNPGKRPQNWLRCKINISP